MQTVSNSPLPISNAPEALPADSGPPEFHPARTPPQKSGGIGLWLRDLFVSAIASVLIITFLYQPVRVEGTSMLPRLEDRDRLFINREFLQLLGRVSQFSGPYAGVDDCTGQ